MVALKLSYTDPETGATYPEALVTITNWRLQGDPPAAEVDLFYYVDQAALNNQLPFRRRQGIVLSPAEINAWIQEFAMAGYKTLAARPEFQNASVVP